MKRCASASLLFVALLPVCGGCKSEETVTVRKDPALAERIETFVDTFLSSGDDDKNAAVLAETRAIFEREGIPSVVKVGDSAAYGFVLINVIGQPPHFQRQFLTSVREAAHRHELPEDALAFAEARRRQTDIEERYRTQTPSHPELRDQIARLFKDDQAVREKDGFDLKKMQELDRRTAGPLQAILDRYAVPTYEMVGVEAAKDFVLMVQHQPPAFRLAELPQLKANVDAGQADPGLYAMVYDATQLDQGKNQRYGERFQCGTGNALDVAPIDDAKNVNVRRAELGLMRLEQYARFLRLTSAHFCAAGVSPK